MSKATGIFLIVAGFGIATFALPSVNEDTERQLSDAMRASIAAGGSHAAAPVAPSAPSAIGSTIQSAGALDTASAYLAAQSINGLAAHESAIAKDAPPKLVIAPTLVTRPVTANAERSAAETAKVIQAELTRVGCYHGEVDGSWTPETRAAMRTFVDHVNASLPVDKPDYILELLVKSHDGIACGNTCPQGQQLAGNGRCLPAVVVAQSNRGSSPASGATLAQRQGRSQVAVPAASSVDARTRLAQPNQTTSSSTAPAVQQVAGADPLPGRMSVGGPTTARGSLALRPTDSLSRSGSDELVPADVARVPTTAVVAVPVAPPDLVPGNANQPRQARATNSRANARRGNQNGVVYYAEPRGQFASSRDAPPPRRRFGPHIFSDQRWNP